MGWFDNKEKDSYDSRNHQDNFRGKDQGENDWDNGSYQYCSFCNANRRFIYDRCEHCKNN